MVENPENLPSQADRLVPDQDPREAEPTSVPVSRVRTSLILSSLSSLRHEGFYDDYRELLDPAYASQVLECVSGAWVPIEVARAHYRACDALGLSERQAIDLGTLVFRRMRGSLLGTALRAGADAAGVGPWQILKAVKRHFPRAFDGGAINTEKLGPKSGKTTIENLSLLEITYFRCGFEGVTRGLLSLASRKVVSKQMPTRDPHSIAYRLDWV